MTIRVAETAGFCYGVNRAVDLVEQTIRAGRPVVTLGPIAHNRHLVRHFEDLGVKVVSDPEQIPDGCAVVIRSHGIPRETYERLRPRDGLPWRSLMRPAPL